MQARLNSTVVLAILLLNAFYVTAQPPLSFRKFQEEEGTSNGFVAYINNRLIVLWLLLLQAGLGYAQPLQFTKTHQEHFVTTIFEDHLGFLWLGTPSGVFRYDGYQFKSFDYIEGDSLSLSNREVWNIVEDREGMIWVGTNNGLNRLDPKREVFTRYMADVERSDGLTDNGIEDLLVDTAGTIWVATANGLCRYLPELGTFKRYLFSAGTVRPSRTPIQSRDGTIWLGARDTLYRYDADLDDFIGFRLPGNETAANAIRLIYEDHQGKLWIGTQLSGAFCFDPNRSTFIEQIKREENKPNGLSSNTVSAFIQDGRELWIGTTGGGLNILNLDTKQMTSHTGTPPDPFGINCETIRDAWEDRNGSIWLGTYYDGLYQYKRSQRLFSHFNQNTGLPSKKVMDIAETADGRIWIALSTGGLGVFDQENQRFIDFYQANSEGLPAGDLNRLYTGEDGQLWVASFTGGISRFDSDSRQFVQLLPKSDKDKPYFNYVNDFLVEESGDIWIALQVGLVKYQKATDSYRSYNLANSKDSKIVHGRSDYVLQIYRDHNEQVWIVTYGGLFLYQSATDSFDFFPFEHQPQGIMEDSQGTLWVGTPVGIFIFDRQSKSYSEIPALGPFTPMLEDAQGRIWLYNSDHVGRYNPKSQEIVRLNHEEGLAEGFYWTMHLSSSGQLFLGGIEGLTIFHPDSIQSSSAPPRVVITDFRLFNKTVPLSDSRADTLDWPSPLSHSITFTENIRLKHWQNYFSLEFAALDLTSPATNRYQYRLVGYDRDWVTTQADRRFVTYTNLNPGRYVFQVRGATRDSPWSPELASVQIQILSPWWATTWAYLTYAVLLFAIIRTIYIFQLRRRLAQTEAQQFKELDAVKTKLYTNITHEFRTPLTVILGMAEKVEEDPKKWLESGIDSIKRNGQGVLHLVNQILDLSRLQIGNLELNMYQGDVIPFVSYLVQSYESYAESKGIQLQVEKRVSSLVMDYAADALSKIISNLISNALKHTSDGGRIEVILANENNQLLVEVKDTGIGIPAEHLPYIFDQFYQVDGSSTRRTEGTGIGLALVKELVNRLKGKIEVQSEEEVGTQFKILLPVSRKAEMEDSIQDLFRLPNQEYKTLTTKDSTTEQANSDLPLVLLVEDNEDVAAYISSCLIGRFQVALANNGKIGVEKALELIPDLIICDVMMPEMDGYEVCKLLKQQERSSHIPIVMLTAKADVDSRLTGLRQGADAYLAKPFKPEELDLRLNNLLYLRGQIQSHFGQFPDSLQSPNTYPQEHEFLNRIKTKILEHLSQDDFGIPELCLAIGLSRSQLHRKLKAITGKSTSLIIRGIRMDEARKLLLHSALTVSEIAYEVGFSSPNYFSTVFSDFYGISPTEMRQKPGMQQ